MFDDINKAIEYIESKRNKRTIEQFKETLKKCHINCKQKNMIHIAGTNGKGSTVNYLRSIFNEHGYNVGTFTSPYLICHNDRIRVDDAPISNDDLLMYINKYYDVIEEDGLSMFEIDVLIMLDYFDSLDLDYRIIETGIGGLHDKTNVIEPIVSVITNVGKDHQEQLGNDIYSIANEKMGIIKKDQLFITSEERGILLARLQEQCDAVGAKMFVVPEYQVNKYPFEFQYRNMSFKLHNVGMYQVTNARLALTIAHKLIKLDAQKTICAIENTSWNGRFEVIPYEDDEVIIDGAHNVPAIIALINTLKVKKEKDIAIVFSALKEKASKEMIELMIKAGYKIYLTSFNDDRIMDLSEYKHDHRVVVIEDYKQAIKVAYLKNNQIVVCGSLHFISTVRKYLLSKRG